MVVETQTELRCRLECECPGPSPHKGLTEERQTSIDLLAAGEEVDIGGVDSKNTLQITHP